MAKINKQSDFDANCLAVEDPDLCRDWHPTKNLPLTIYNFAANKTIVIWWKCHECSYEWQAHINGRRTNYKRIAGHSLNGTKCPNCAGMARTPKNSFAAKNPEMIPEYNSDNLELLSLIPNSYKEKLDWKCINCGNEWSASPKSRSGNTDCILCQGRKRK